MIDCFFPSSRLCRFCGCINSNLTLADRIWTCSCGAILDRDRNAAQNIERQALKMFAGVGSRRTETHVEQMLDSQEQSVMKRENMAEERQPSNPAVV
jgi:transposase